MWKDNELLIGLQLLLLIGYITIVEKVREIRELKKHG